MKMSLTFAVLLSLAIIPFSILGYDILRYTCMFFVIICALVYTSTMLKKTDDLKYYLSSIYLNKEEFFKEIVHNSNYVKKIKVKK